MRMFTASGPDPWSRRMRALLAVAGLIGTAAGCAETGEGTPDESVLECTRDESVDPASAIPLTFGAEPVEDFICPLNDADWYDLSLGPDDRLVTVRLGIGGAAISPVEPTYAIWSKTTVRCEGDPELDPEQCTDLGLAPGGEYVVPDTVVAQPAAELLGIPEGVEFVHCLQPGEEYFLSVRDLQDDAQDVRRPYVLEVTAAPDPDTDEPNDNPDAAIPLASGSSASGEISCAGDQDFYRIDAQPGSFLEVELTTNGLPTNYEPRIDVFDAEGTLIESEQNLRGRIDPTLISFCRVLPSAGTFFLTVRDDDGRDADPDVSYGLTVRSAVDADGNEPNNNSREATALATVSCTTGNEATITGTLACGGDNDWFEVDLAGCAVGDLIEAEVSVGEGVTGAAAWELQDRVQAAVTLIRSDPVSPCDEDGSCTVLQRTCDGRLDCAGFGDSCLESRGGFCGGVTACLPNGQCGATQVSRNYRRVEPPMPLVGNPPPNVATVSGPILATMGQLFLRVSDFQADGGDASAIYTLRVRARQDPDVHEPNNVFFNRLTDMNAELTEPGVKTPIPACPATARGAIGYQNDVDWWTFPKTCPEAADPGQDCPLVLRMGFGTGEVPAVAVVIADESRGPRFSRDLAAGTGMGELIGGAANCGYQFRDDSGPYTVEIRDVDETDIDTDTPDLEQTGREWDPDQEYEICYVPNATPGCPANCDEEMNPDTGALECDSP